MNRNARLAFPAGEDWRPRSALHPRGSARVGEEECQIGNLKCTGEKASRPQELEVAVADVNQL